MCRGFWAARFARWAWRSGVMREGGRVEASLVVMKRRMKVESVVG